MELGSNKRQCMVAPPTAVQQALMALKGQTLYIHAAPLWQQFCNQALCFGRGPAELRTEGDSPLAVVARPKRAVALRLLVWKRDVLVCTEDEECFIANLDTLARMHLRVHDVLPPGSIVHAWLYSTRSGRVSLGAYDLIACQEKFLQGSPPFARSARLHQLFELAAQRVASEQREPPQQAFEYFWVGQLGSDAALALKPAAPVTAQTCTGACAMLYDARCPYDVDVFVTVPEACEAPWPARWIDATPARDLSKGGPRDRVAALRVAVPPFVPAGANGREARGALY
jgi:hypothetical protein